MAGAELVDGVDGFLVLEGEGCGVALEGRVLGEQLWGSWGVLLGDTDWVDDADHAVRRTGF